MSDVLEAVAKKAIELDQSYSTPRAVEMAVAYGEELSKPEKKAPVKKAPTKPAAKKEEK